MITDQVLSFIRDQIAQGKTPEDIRQILMAQGGWSSQDIDEAFKAASESTIPVSTPPIMNTIPDTSSTLSRAIKFTGAFVVLVLVVCGAYLFISKGKEKEVSQVNTTSGTVQPFGDSLENTKTTAVLDCKTDTNCLIEAAKTCALAKGTHIQKIDAFGVKQVASQGFEFLGLKDGRCDIKVQILKSEATFPEGTPQEIIDQQKVFMKKLEGRQGFCSFATQDLSEMLSRWAVGTYKSGEVSCALSTEGTTTSQRCTVKGGDFGNAQCTGEYFNPALN